MSFPSVSLYQTASGTVAADGTVSIVFNPCPSGRVWQGTVSISDGSIGSQWKVSVGGQTIGDTNSPGPSGPYQIQAGGFLSLSSTGFSPGGVASAFFTGVDDPKEAATPYTGPSIATSIQTGSP